MTPNEDLIGEYLDHLAREHPDSTVSTYRTALRGADRTLPAGLFSLDTEIAAWLAGYGRATRSVYRAALVGWYRHATEHGWIDYNPPPASPQSGYPAGRPGPAPTTTWRPSCAPRPSRSAGGPR